jgi:DNA-binding XRE family transcriptional regulator
MALFTPRGLKIRLPRPYRLAQLAQLDQRAVSRIEKGEFSPTLRALLKLSSALGLKLSAVFWEVEQSHRAA